MKFFHLADLHIGKIVSGFSMLNEQRLILNKIYKLAIDNKIKGVIIAGDIYDKSVPPSDAIDLFDKFITDLSEANIICFIVSGNHDSAQRISFGASIMAKNNIYISKTYNGKLEPIYISDKTCKKLAVWMLPFVRPTDVRPYHEKDKISCGSYNEAIQAIVNNIELDKSYKNIIIAHQFITANGVSPIRSDSENSSLGTLDNVDYKIFKDFDYVALGHIHNPQCMGNKKTRYAGSPLKYSFSEINQKKSITILDVTEEGVSYTEIPLIPNRDFREIRGTFEDIIKGESDDYMHITLTDDFIPDVKSRLEDKYPNIMQLDYDNKETNINNYEHEFEKVNQKSISEHFSDFFYIQNARELDKSDEFLIKQILETMEGVDEADKA